MSCNGCRVLRKGCSDKCVLRHCLRCIDSAEAQANATLFVTKFFGRAGLTGFINGVAESQRPALFQSLLYEACGRTVNPVYGAVGLLFSGNWAVCQGAVETVLRGGSLKPVDTGAALSSSATVPSSSLSNVDYVCPSTSMIETHHMISKPQNSGSRGAQPQVTTSTVDQYLDTCELRVKAIPSATYLDSKSCPAELKFLPDVTSYGDCSRSDQATIRSRSDGQTALLNAENHAVRKKARSSFPLHASTKNLGHTDLDFTNAVEMRDLINSSIRSSSNTDQNHCAAEMRDLINSSIRSSSNTDQNHCAVGMRDLINASIRSSSNRDQNHCAVEMRDLINSSTRSYSNTDQNHCAEEMRDLINSSIRSSSNTDQNHCALDDSQTSAGDLRQAPDVDYDGMHKRHRSDNSEQEAQCPQAHLELVAPARRRMHISWHVDQRTAEKGDKNGRSCGASLPTHSSYYSYNSPFNEAQFINRGDGVVSMISSDRIQNESGESMIRLNLALRTSLSSTSNQAEHSRVCLQERRDFIPDRQPQELHRGSSPSINSEGSVNTTLAANDVAVKLQTSISHGPSKEGVKLLNLLL